jgi:hypothetical protein
MDLEKDDVRKLRLLPGAATAEKYRISDFRETPKDQPRVLAGPSGRAKTGKKRKNRKRKSDRRVEISVKREYITRFVDCSGFIFTHKTRKRSR